ncbi:FGGY-family carbohydrate kinase [Ningiella sp. W23]|uniref:FGGY-family carbohydrate kinase n=1 Tax=Ningiella sp. W23 TaxID=3023715 RepID=UPI003756A7E6
MINERQVYTLIIDIGKTHVKLHVLDANFKSVHANQMPNTVNHQTAYPSANIDGIWHWLCESIKAFTPSFLITHITITTHGASAALIDRDSSEENGLVLPVLDYEYGATHAQSEGYEQIRPPFNESFSPSLPAGLNLGRQLFWLKQKFPKKFSQASHILMYPQYWAWRFTGTLVSEVTSFGCHTDLWSVKNNSFSSLVDALDCRDLVPPMKPAWFNCGVIHEHLRSSLGLDEDCQFFSGIHDSNASFLRYRLAKGASPFTVISTGTWTILMASQTPLEKLDASRDMLANVDALGEPIACARFMGGREFESICEQAGSWLGEQFDECDLKAIIHNQVFALPDFSEGSGPFGGRQPQFIGHVDKVSGSALATLYCALMIDYQLSSLQARGDVIIEGAFLKNPLLCAVLNQLRSDQDVSLSLDATGTVLGAAYLSHWQTIDANIELKKAECTQLDGLSVYRDKWLSLLS